MTLGTHTEAGSDTDLTQERLKALVERILAEARRQGASAAEAAVSVAQGLSVTVRLAEVETVEHNRDKNLDLTVFFGHKSASASTSDFSEAAIHDTVRAACSIAQYMAEDECTGLADAERLAADIPDLDLYHPWRPGTKQAIELARECETAARGVDARIKNSEGATVSSHEGTGVYGNTHGFIAAVPTTRHSLSCSVIAQENGGMQRDYWYSVARDSTDLETSVQVGRKAGERALRRLGARKLSTRDTSVVFEAPVASSLLSHLVSAIRGSSLYREASFLLDHIGKKIFTDHVSICEQPHIKKALGSAVFDNEGVATATRDIVAAGVLQSYVLDSYSARKLGLHTTGNAGGVHNLEISRGERDLAALLRDMGTGLLITELIGFGVNIVTGDYSRGASGFWVDGGEIQYPVEEITVAGNLKSMFMDVVAVGSDIDTRGNIRTGSILIGNMTVAGD
ncbi:MAG: metalloprotease PmbA [Acidiferrobacterales bacterium]